MGLLIFKSYSGNRGSCSDRNEGSVIVALMEVVMVMDGLEISYKALISGWRSCVVCDVTISTPLCVLVT